MLRNGVVDFLLSGAEGEYGRGVPVEFSDAPTDYYVGSCDFAYYVLVDPLRLFPGSEWETKLVEMLKEGTVFENGCLLMLKKTTSSVDYTAYPKQDQTGYSAFVRWGKSYEQKMKKWKQATSATLATTLKPLQLPFVVIQLITEVLCKPANIL